MVVSGVRIERPAKPIKTLRFLSDKSIIQLDKLELVKQMRTDESLPCVKGGGTAQAVTEGLSCSQSIISSWFLLLNNCEKK